VIDRVGGEGRGLSLRLTGRGEGPLPVIDRDVRGEGSRPVIDRDGRGWGLSL